jgi:predicted Zn-dependent protease with MMP-like domain
VIDVPLDRFEELVAEALDSIPDELADRMENVAVQVHDDAAIRGLLGLYEGIPLTDRENYGGMVMPDRITIYRRPICAICTTEDEVREQVRVTVIHEVGHHFGIDDARLHELGWG